MRHLSRPTLSLLLSLSWALGGCGSSDFEPPPGSDAGAVDSNSLPFTCADLEAVPGALVGCVTDLAGAPVAGALVTRDTLSATTDDQGVFAFDQALDPGNALLEVTAAGYRAEQLVHRFPEQSRLEPIVLIEDVPGRARFLFGGDVSFARRFLDPDDSTPRGVTPPDDPDALILVSDPLPGSLEAVSFIQPYYQDADVGVVNFESPVTDTPATPHPTKDYVYFTLPGSLEALLQLGVTYASLGNNHIYDYLEQGLLDTLVAFDAIELPHSGAGPTVEAAFMPHAFDVAGATFSMLSMTSIAGAEHNIEYVASATQGGAADLRELAPVLQAIEDEKLAGRIPIAQFHMGFEYTYEPSAGGVERMLAAIDAGAALVIAHHPHVAQGFGWHKDALMAHSLGNLLFDQDRLETMLGVMVRTDMDGSAVASARAIPVYLEDYRPRPIGGELATRFLRRLGEFSHGHGAVVIPYLGQGWIARASDPLAREQREVVVELDIPASGWTVLDLRQVADAHESLARADTDTPGVSMRIGRDLMLYGDFEDWDVDAQTDETARWDFGSATTLCTQALRGRSALCSERSATNTQDARVFFRNRVRVMGESLGMPNKEVSLVVHGRGDNAGEVIAEIVYAASVGNQTFASETVPLYAPGTYDDAMVAAELELPPDDPLSDPLDPTAHARALFLELRHTRPVQGTGVFTLDDVAVVNWEEDITNRDLAVPHARDFVLVSGPSGPVTLTLTLERLVPAPLSGANNKT